MPAIEEGPVTPSLDPAMVASDPSPLDEVADTPAQPDAFQVPEPDVAPAPAPELFPTPEPIPAAEPVMPPVAPEPQQVTVTVDQPQQSTGSSVPSFLTQPKPAESAPAAPQPSPVPAPQPVAAAPGDVGLPPVVVHTGRKSRKLLIVIVLVLLLAGGGAAAYFLMNKDDSTRQTNNTTSDSESENTENSEQSNQDETPSVAAITATSTSEFDAVCDGGAISNAAAYTDSKSAVIYTFHNKPTSPDSWSSIFVGYGKSYYLEDLDNYADINTVACLKYDAGDAGEGKACEYTSSGQTVTVTYKPLTYTMTLREAKTGKQIGDTQKIDGPATECPSSVLYDQATKTAYAEPDEDALEAAFDTFVR
jgi:hypothetical protein